jgi:hypothetical protein
MNPPLDFTIHAVNIFYRDKLFRFGGGIGGLTLAITADVEQFLTPHRKSARVHESQSTGG